MSKTDVASLPGYQFDFSGAHLGLDFANTLSDRLMEQPIERLKSYADLLAWSVQAELLPAEKALELMNTSEQRREEAEVVRKQGIILREAIHAVFLALAEERIPADSELAMVSAAYVEALKYAKLVPHEQHVDWQWQIPDEALEGPLWLIAHEALDLLTSEEVRSVRVCAADDCNWLFLDTSKNHSRRWCDMKTCGNRAKVRRFQDRKKQV